MHRFFVFWALGILFSWGQVVPQENGYKLLAFDQKDQFVSDALVKGTDIIFAVPSVDSVLGSMPGYPYRGTRMIRIDSSMQVVAEVNIRPDSMTILAIYDLFWWAPDVIGFVGQGIQIDTTTQDSTAFLFVGSMQANFSQITISPKYFKRNFIPFYGFPELQIRDVIPVNDSIALVSCSRDTLSPSPIDFEYYILTFKRQDLTSTIFLVDSIAVDPTISHEGGYFYHYATNNLPNIFYIDYPGNNSVGNIRNYKITSVHPIQLDTLSTIFPGNIFENGSRGTLLKPVTQNDTLWVYGNQTFSSTLYKLQKNGIYGFSLTDSVKLFPPFSMYYYHKNLAISSSCLYLIKGQYVIWKSLMYQFWNFYEFQDTTYNSNNSFSVCLFDSETLLQKGEITLGGDAIYEVFGIIAPSDSICIVYGWRFPLGDLTRTDGDAFIWKITWDGLVTPILGEAPKYAFKIFPNPAKNILKISGKTKEATTFLLRSLDGKEVLTQKFPAGQEDWELDVSQIPRGIYLLEILTEGGARFTEKVMLE